MRRSARIAVAAASLASTSLVFATVSDASGGATRPPLDIVLTNDDGWNAPGITAVYDALVAAGHRVVLVAPATNQSGVGARATFGGSLVVTQPAPGKNAVAGTPADAAEFALSVVKAGDRPDLLISGTNAGQNIAAAAIHSGTVGAAVTAMNDGVPAIAVSTEIDFATGTGPYTETASFVVRLVEALRTRKGDLVLPPTSGLNVNYPIVADGGAPRGVAVTQTGRGFLDIGFGAGSLPEVGGTSTYPIAISIASEEPVEGADSTALAADEVAITIIAPNYDAERGGLGRVRSAVRELDHHAG